MRSAVSENALNTCYNKHNHTEIIAKWQIVICNNRSTFPQQAGAGEAVSKNTKKCATHHLFKSFGFDLYAVWQF